MTQDTTAPGNPESGADSFDFLSWLERKAKFPKFDHTAFLDQEAGAALADVDDELEELAEENERLGALLRRHQENPSGALVDVDMDKHLQRAEEVGRRIDALAERRKELERRVLDSRVRLFFEVKNPEEMGMITRQATREFEERHPEYKDAGDDDLDVLTIRSRYVLAAQIAYFCTHMVVIDEETGEPRTVPAPNRAGAEAFLGRLITSETMRLMEAIGTKLAANRDWASSLDPDAGFPGRGSDVETVCVGAHGPEVGSLVGGSADHHADGPAV